MQQLTLLPDAVQLTMIRLYEQDRDGDDNILDFVERFRYCPIVHMWEAMWGDVMIGIKSDGTIHKWDH